MLKKKMVSNLMIVVICLSCFFPCNVSVHASNKKMDESNLDKVIVATVIEWAEMMEPNISFCVGDIKKVQLLSSEEIEYTASLFHNTIPYGYVILKYMDNDIVVTESNIEKGREGLYPNIVDIIVENSEEERLSLDIDNTIVQISPLQYGLKYEDEKGNECITDNYGNKVEDEKMLKTSEKYDTAWEIYIESYNWQPSRYKVDESSKIILNKYQKNKKLITQKRIEDITGKYACGVQALIQIAYMEKLVSFDNNANIKSTYNRLWKYTKTTETKKSKKNTSKDKVIYGEGDTKETVKGFIKFAKEKGYNGTQYKGIQKNPSIAWIKDKLNYNRPILMGYGINVNEKYSGHFISILGYMGAKKMSSGNTWNYLMVYNGWDNTVSYLNYTCVDFIDCEASYFWVKK